MKRTVPTADADIINLYMRTYYSLLRTTEEVQIRTLEETHTAMYSILHERAGELVVDMSAFIYGSLRLPRCILDTHLVLMGQSEEVFRRRGYPDVESWQHVVAKARRRPMFFDGKEILAAYIASVSDVDDIVPTLTAFQIEWNKLHWRLTGTQLGSDLAQGLLTLPSIYYLEQHPGDERILDVLNRRTGTKGVRLALEVVRNSGVITQVKKEAAAHARLAAEALQTLPPNEYRQALIALAHDTVEREW